MLDDAGEWSCWTDWSECSVSCGVGYKQRSRQCMVPNNKGLEGSGCEGSALSQEPCEMPSCQCKSLVRLEEMNEPRFSEADHPPRALLVLISDS